MCSESDALIKTYVSNELLDSVNLKEYRGSFKFYIADVIKDQFIADQYSVRDLPTTIIFKDGENIASSIGPLSAKRLKSLVEKI
ncbi:hypothetical protein BRARA_E01558 [Brassica rapa]|uniref:Thioredoxin domain-containing protein n=1 Tax=Brassica campestris TaxID=3711 RepID=A0A397ZBY3_BRACM|nr:hypothetical protein BRARA_E01558 [Brassica rapa]